MSKTKKSDLNTKWSEYENKIRETGIIDDEIVLLIKQTFYIGAGAALFSIKERGADDVDYLLEQAVKIVCC